MCLVQPLHQEPKSEEEIEGAKEKAAQEELQHRQLTKVDTLLLERNQKEHYARAARDSSNGEESNPANHVPSSGIASVVRGSTAPQQNGTASISAPGVVSHGNGPVGDANSRQQPTQQQRNPPHPPAGPGSVTSRGVGHSPQYHGGFDV